MNRRFLLSPAQTLSRVVFTCPPLFLKHTLSALKKIAAVLLVVQALSTFFFQRSHLIVFHLLPLSPLAEDRNSLPIFVWRSIGQAQCCASSTDTSLDTTAQNSKVFQDGVRLLRTVSRAGRSLSRSTYCRVVLPLNFSFSQGLFQCSELFFF